MSLGVLCMYPQIYKLTVLLKPLVDYPAFQDHNTFSVESVMDLLAKLDEFMAELVAFKAIFADVTGKADGNHPPDQPPPTMVVSGQKLTPEVALDNLVAAMEVMHKGCLEHYEKLLAARRRARSPAATTQ